MAKLPAPPPVDELVALGPDVVAVATHTVLWRIHGTSGPHALPWNQLRGFGPLDSARFDPHPLPASEDSGEGVLYLALDVATCLAEVYQRTRTIARRRGAPYLTGMRLTRTVQLLDLTGTWPTRAGASMALCSTPRRDLSRQWARALRSAYPSLDGLWHPSSMHGNDPCVTLWPPASDALPDRPEVSVPLAHPALAPALAAAAEDLGYRLL